MSTTLSIDTKERAQLETLARSTKDAKTAIRIRVILALDDGYRIKDVAAILRLDEDTVAKWRNKFRKRKRYDDWLSTNANGYSGKLSVEQEQAITQYVTDELVTDAGQVVGFIGERFGIDYTLNGATKVLHHGRCTLSTPDNLINLYGAMAR